MDKRQKGTAAECVRDLSKHASEKRAVVTRRFFKTGKGEYGEGDVFVGISVPDIRCVARLYLDMNVENIGKLMCSKVHEFRLCALIILVEQYKKAGKEEQKMLYTFFVQHVGYVNNWDLVDTSVPQIAGHFLYEHKTERERIIILKKWMRNRSLWIRRVAVLATFYGIRRNDFSGIQMVAFKLLSDKEDLIHKAVGWMLREAGKRDTVFLHNFLKDNFHDMPRTMLRYAVERLPALERHRYMNS